MKNLHPIVWGMLGAAAFALIVKRLPVGIASMFTYDPSSGAYTFDADSEFSNQ